MGEGGGGGEMNPARSCLSTQQYIRILRVVGVFDGALKERALRGSDCPASALRSLCLGPDVWTYLRGGAPLCGGQRGQLQIISACQQPGYLKVRRTQEKIEGVL